MKTITGLAVGAMAMVILSGCNNVGTEPGDIQGSIKIERQVDDYAENEDDTRSCVEIKNSTESDYYITDIWSGPIDGAYVKSFPNGTPPNDIAPGSQRTFCSTNCGADEWKIKVQDDRSAVAEGKYQRVCGYTELLLVTTLATTTY